jgi:hypothetical protein
MRRGVSFFFFWSLHGLLRDGDDEEKQEEEEQEEEAARNPKMSKVPINIDLSILPCYPCFATLISPNGILAAATTKLNYSRHNFVAAVRTSAKT